MYGVSINWKEWKRSLSMKWCYYSYSKTALDTRPRHISLSFFAQWIMAAINNPFLAKNFLWIIVWTETLNFCRHCRHVFKFFRPPKWRFFFVQHLQIREQLKKIATFYFPMAIRPFSIARGKRGGSYFPRSGPVEFYSYDWCQFAEIF